MAKMLAIYHVENCLSFYVCRGIVEARFTFVMVVLFVTAELYGKNTVSKHTENGDDCNKHSELYSDNLQQGSQFVECAQSVCIMLIVLLAKPHNIILVAMVTTQEQLICRYFGPWIFCLQPYAKLLYCMWMGQASFYYQVRLNFMLILYIMCMLKVYGP